MRTGYANPYSVAEASSDARAAFIKKTYLHLAGAIAAFAGCCALLLNMEWSVQLAGTMMNNWLLVIVAFMVVSFIADKWAMSDTSRGQQYLGLGLFIVAESFIFLPILLMAQIYGASKGQDIIGMAALTTGILVAGLTTVVFVTGKDFSFMRGFLMVGGFVALGVIVASIAFGFQLGIIFSGAMVLFACASILYTTSNIIHHYRTEQYVAASLSLFAGVALLFWYILQIFMSRD